LNEALERWAGRGAGEQEISISVLIPCWHGERTIRTALDSVESQHGLPVGLGIEIVLVVDGRWEDYATIRDLLAETSQARRWPITVLRLPQRQGVGAARAAGYVYCRGQYLALLDDDDVWHPDKLATQWHWHQDHPSCIASCHGYQQSIPERDISLRRWLIGGCMAATPTVMINRACWPYEPERFCFGEDWLMLAMIAHRHPIHALPAQLAWRSPLAPPSCRDTHGLSRQHWRLRLAMVRNLLLLSQRGVLAWGWIPMLLLWQLVLILRRLALSITNSIKNESNA